VPAGLATDHPRLTVVHHDELFADPEALPTFNNFAIEQHLHRLPGLAPHFLYMNDDYLFGCAVKPGHFLTRDGRIKIYLERDITSPGDRRDELSDPYGRIVANTNRYLERCFGKARRRHFRHGPVLFRTALAGRLAAEPEVRAAVRNRFRSPTDIALDYGYCQSVLADPAVATAVPLWLVYLRTHFAMVNNDLAQQKRNLRWIARLRPRFFCLNDDMGLARTPRWSPLVRAFLERRYPQKSAFER
jgi:hypothetical protein